MHTKVGTKVIAIMNATETTVFSLGEGTYLGDLEVTAEALGCSQEEYEDFRKEWQFVQATLPEELRKPYAEKFLNPCILLDNGKKVWGFECYWGPVEVIVGQLDGRKIVMVDVNEDRAKTKEEVEKEINESLAYSGLRDSILVLMSNTFTSQEMAVAIGKAYAEKKWIGVVFTNKFEDKPELTLMSKAEMLTRDPWKTYAEEAIDLDPGEGTVKFVLCITGKDDVTHGVPLIYEYEKSRGAS